MSLLMQALKKAERAQQNSAGHEELDKPSQEFDEILALTPEPALPASMSAASTRQEPELSLEPLAGLSLEPMTPAPQAAATAASEGAAAAGAAPAAFATAPAGPAGTHSLDFPAGGASAAPTPTPAADAGLMSTASAAAADYAGLNLDKPAPTAARPPAATAAKPAATTASDTAATAPAAAAKTAAAGNAAAARASQQAGASAREAAARTAPRAPVDSPRNEKADAPRGAARARARAAAASSPEHSGIDPERLRLFGLIGLLVLIIAGFGYYYWQAVMAPGAGARLPPVPMPPPGATGATPAQVVSAPARSSEAAPPAEDGALLPSAPKNNGQRDELERRLTQAEQQLAATQQALQAQLNAPQPASLPPLAAPESSDIRVARGQKSEPLAAALGGAYQALNTGELASARQQYEAVLQQDGNNRDALLALASIASREQQPAQAASYYLRLLELDPRDGAAIAGMVGLRQGDPAQNEVRLKGILASNPEAAPVHFALGNLYAQQNRWQEAQQAYFRAYSAAPTNPDYAYNLAIGLDRLNQGKLAQTYYQRALALAQNTAAAFDRAALAKRLQELGASAR
ncbi:tetratricopeptide repeat protein [Pseudoduganella danionis]|uniref:Tetratricopeptide repeat protein n=1 Tax=Pseudoduganella danionis TaxID=1890295 RepID=A0ABW9SM13_9BURK|nr:tetratricopeptide repeat protein [Pseudoduganella danionis]MTW32705.1 tetratricopeptide repeat protein [Pseudoduganella danionis]